MIYSIKKPLTSLDLFQSLEPKKIENRCSIKANQHRKQGNIKVVFAIFLLLE